MVEFLGQIGLEPLYSVFSGAINYLSCLVGTEGQVPRAGKALRLGIKPDRSLHQTPWTDKAAILALQMQSCWLGFLLKCQCNRVFRVAY